MNKKLGYYSVDGIEFDSKIQACIFANTHQKDVVWHFNDKLFKSYDWTIEPVESIDELYNKRARQIRESYDYVIISYSGGADSHNALVSFIRQGLHIDEILVNTMEKGNKNFMPISSENMSSDNAAASEHVLQALPRLQEIHNQCPKTKITVVDLTDFLFESFLKVGDASWVMNKREGLNPLNATRYNYLYFSEVRKRFDKDKKIALVLGVEKPKTVIKDDNKFYVRFMDRSANVASVNDHIKEYPNATVEYFYWSPEGADIVCKQAHIIKQWLEQDPITRYHWWHYKNFENNKTSRLVHERLLRTMIYTTWDPFWYQADKSTRDWYSEFDTWFLTGYRDTKQYHIWKEGIQYVENNAKKFVNTARGYPDGLTVFMHNYYVGKMNFPITLQEKIHARTKKDNI